jgi:general secretion pathway protein D
MKINKDRTENELVINPGAQNSSAAGRPGLTTSSTPTPPAAKAFQEPIQATTSPPLTGEPISINFDSVRLPAFVNTVFGELLKVTFEIDNSVALKDQIVTLRTAEPLSPDKFLRLVKEVLGNYGISVVYSNGVYRIIESTNVKQSIPRIVRTRARGEIPSDMRPIFYLQPLNNVSVATMQLWMQIALKDRIQAIGIPNFNGLLLLGNTDDVDAAIDIMNTLDQPYMAGAKSVRIAPAFWSATKLAQQLTEIMNAEGYSIGVGGQSPNAIRLVPIEALNVIIAFGTGEDAIQHVLQWAAELDQPGQTIGTKGVFYHQIHNAKAKDLAVIVKGLLGQGSASATDQKAGGGEAQTNLGGGRQQIVVDEPRNGLIFMGSAEEYAQFRALIDQMDRAPYEVMIEATVAEITLSRNENLGVTLGFDDGSTFAPNRQAVSTGNAGIFYNLIRSRGQITAKINALADKNKIQVLSSPRLVTSSGKSASISVGTDVPIVTAQETAQSQVGGNSGLLQSIQYRSTGIILSVEPTINSSRRVELTVSQEVSSAAANSTSSVSSPAILKRSVQTTLSLDDGQTVLLGGLISENYTEGNSGVPYLKDVPLLGNLFKNQSRGIDRTELIVLLTPYIIDSVGVADQVRDNFRAKLSDWTSGNNDPQINDLEEENDEAYSCTICRLVGRIRSAERLHACHGSIGKRATAGTCHGDQGGRPRAGSHLHPGTRTPCRARRYKGACRVGVAVRARRRRRTELRQSNRTHSSCRGSRRCRGAVLLGYGLLSWRRCTEGRRYSGVMDGPRRSARPRNRRILDGSLRRHWNRRSCKKYVWSYALFLAGGGSGR